MRYTFEGFTLDTDRCVVMRGSEILRLRPKVFDLLRFLIEQPRKIATKNELLENLWKDVTVEEASLTQCVASLRRALAPEGARLIRTSPRRGYVLDADVERVTEEDRPPPKHDGLGWLLGGIALGVTLTWSALAFLDRTAAREAGALTDTRFNVVGQPIAFGEANYRVVAGIKTLEPGQHSGWHAHRAPVFGYLLSGEITTDYGRNGVRRFPENSVISEAVNLAHDVFNEGPEQAEIFVIEFMPLSDDLVVGNFEEE